MKIFRKLRKLNLKSIVLNFRLFSFHQALYFPLLVAKNVRIVSIYRGGYKCVVKNFSLV